jgi:hypothetical protein
MLVAAINMFFLLPSANAGFVGHQFDATYFFPDAVTPYAQASFAPNPFIVGSGVDTVGDVEGVVSLDVDFEDTMLTIVLETTLLNPIWSATPFNGPVFSLLSPGTLDILSFSVDPATTMAGFDASRVLISDSSIGINWERLSYVDGTVVKVNVEFIPEPIPEPPVVALLGLGLGGLSYLRRARQVSNVGRSA